MSEQKPIESNVKVITNFKDWRFKDPPSYSELPIDTNPEYDQTALVKNAVFSKAQAKPLNGKLQLVCVSEDCLKDIFDLDPAVADTEEFLDFVAGKYSPAGAQIVCHRYGGHQFGLWVDQLGDGRAHILGEYINSKGETWQPQLKGSGETPYSRFADGRAILQSSIREMVASEACHNLGIPTTRAAAMIVSDDHMVWRDPFYSGQSRQRRAAMVMRVAPCWYRLGSIEILSKRRERNVMKALLDHIIEHYFPNIASNDEDKYSKLFSEVAMKNLDMVAAWQAFGFTHSVLNTDNVSMLGLTLDYGPFAFLDHYYHHYLSNTTDDLGRYAFDRQPTIMIWNLERFADALELILSEEQKKKISVFKKTLQAYVDKRILEMYIHKLGLQKEQNGDQALMQDILEIMEQTMADFTCTFRQLSEVDPKDLTDKSTLESNWALAKASESIEWEEWVKKFQDRLVVEDVTEEERRARALRVNPAYVPRNWMLQEATLDAQKNDFEKVRFLLKIFQKPFDRNEEADKRGYSSAPPSWAAEFKLSCSS